MKLSFAQWLRLRRDLAGLTQTQLAKALGTTPSTVSNWEKEVSVPALNPEQTRQLCLILNVTLEELAKAFRGELTFGD